MTRYWINFKGKQSGPHSIEELKGMGVDKTAYVWYSGLDDWVKITKVPELNEMLEKMAAQGAQNATHEAAADNVSELPVDEEPNVPPMCNQPSGAMNYSMNQGGYNPQYAGGYAAASPTVDEAPKCPPTNLVWAIISTICCCWPLGVVGIIFAYLTKKKYKEGDYPKAEKFSEYGAWAIIASIIIGLISTPLACSQYILQSVG